MSCTVAWLYKCSREREGGEGGVRSTDGRVDAAELIATRQGPAILRIGSVIDGKFHLQCIVMPLAEAS